MTLDGSILQRGLDLALGFHQGQRWPGSGIPYLAHALEVACRAAALGGDDATVLAALLHDARRDRDEAEVLASIRPALGERVADLLEAGWSRHLFPHPGWEDWLPGGWERLEDPGLRLLVVCDALAGFRSTLLDWEVLAHLWAEPRSGDPADRAWLLGTTGLPGPERLTRARWLPAGPEHPSPAELRWELVDFHRRWQTLPVGDVAATAPFPSLALAHRGGAWERWVDRQGLVPVIRGWGWAGPARELAGLLNALRGLPALAEAGFLRMGALDPGRLPGPAFQACLRRMSMLELMLVLRNPGSPLVRAFRRQVPPAVLDLGLDPPGHPEQASLSEPILLYWLGRVAREDGLLAFPALGNPDPAPVVPLAEPTPARFGAALALVLEQQGRECWPGSTIPYVFHPLEVASLVLTAGWGEGTATLALFHDLPRTEATLERVAAGFGAALAGALESCWSLPGPVHRVPGPAIPADRPVPAGVRAVGLMDATSLFRFVAEDYRILAPGGAAPAGPRRELADRYGFFRGILHGQPLAAIAETVLFQSRFGASRADWARALAALLPPPAGQGGHPPAPGPPPRGELGALFARLEFPVPELLGLVSLLEVLPGESVRRLIAGVGPERAASAFLDETWDLAWQALAARLEPDLTELLAWELLGCLADTGARDGAQRAVLAMATRLVVESGLREHVYLT